LDNIDTENLALYCDVCAKYKSLSENATTIEDIKALQAWGRLQTSLAEKLGFTPAARARLAKKDAEKPPKDPFANVFD
jgi:phage terminase small subunit